MNFKRGDLVTATNQFFSGGLGVCITKDISERNYYSVSGNTETLRAKKMRTPWIKVYWIEKPHERGRPSVKFWREKRDCFEVNVSLLKKVEKND